MGYSEVGCERVFWLGWVRVGVGHFIGGLVWER